MLLILALSSVVGADSTYTTEALRALVARASDANRRVPAALVGYEAKVESELSLILRLSDGRETVAQVEQTASRVRWNRGGDYEQRVTGYRARSVGPNISALTYMRQAYTVPVLYGNRLSLFFGAVDSTRRANRTRRDSTRGNRDAPVVTVHPFSAGRDAYYRFEGGDTVSSIETVQRRIPIARIRVHPHGIVKQRTWVFDGEIDLDADRAEIVRMRGAFVMREPSTRWTRRVSETALEGLFVVELVNAEVGGRYWLPSFQRIEGQVMFGLAGDTRSVLRVASAFREYDLTLRDSALFDSAAAAADSIRVRPKRLTFAHRDSLDRYDDWVDAPGQLSAPLHADDFMEFAPETWRPRGRPILVWRPERAAEIVRFNRVEGLFTGVAASVRLRDRLPGASFGGSAGWAWSERQARGEGRARWARGATVIDLSAGRSLASTNDFRRELDMGATIPALFAAIDDYDYVDRRFTSLGLSRALGRSRSVVVGVRGGVASDWPVVARLERGPIGGDFRPNRGSTGGRYRHANLRVAFAPQVSGEFLRPGAGMTITAEVADGDLEWHRVEMLVTGRRDMGRLTIAGRGDLGVVGSPGDIPPQRLLELGGSQGLRAYDYKTFVGDRAGLLRAAVTWDLGFAKAPVRFGRLVLPGLAPMLGVTGEAGATRIANDNAARGVALLGIASPRDTEGVRSSIEMGLRFFGGALGVGVARALDHHDRWRPVVSFSQMQ